MRNEETTLDEAVENGAKLLDQKNPTWASKIDIEGLDLHSCSECLLGQLYEYYDDGVLELFDVDGDEEDLDEFMRDDASNHGYDCNTSELGEITELWVDAIQSRLETTQT